MSCGRRGAGSASWTTASVAIRLRQVFSPADSRVRNVRVARSAAFRVASRRCPGRITIPLPSTLSTSSVVPAAGAEVRAA
ncbi:hypothetical protein QFZ76_009963 [Streptomyces sp. V4I2]|nr:hypothetical protein [Streptomyces sp. V4I2]